jgi:hypothetical protein
MPPRIFRCQIYKKNKAQKKANYSSIHPANYLAGKFNPSDYLSDGLFKKYAGSILRWETLYAYKCLKEAWKKNHSYPLKIISSTRNFSRQAGIWNAKFYGKRQGYQTCPKMTPSKCARYVLRYSSMPGTSRHHWGTDIDLISLDNDFFKKGIGNVFYLWMKKNARKFGFCQPYTSGRNLNRGGYMEERWHWSFLPLAGSFLKDWNKYLANKTIAGFGGTASPRKIPELEKLQKIYVNNINSACK